MPNRKMGRVWTLRETNTLDMNLKGTYINETTGMNLIERITLRMTIEEKETIKGALDTIEREKDAGMYNGKALQVLFNYWGKYMPNQKQSIDCNGCRKFVVKFWKKINEEFSK